MAINVYMSLFRRYNVKQLKSLEWRYFVACYGVTFIIAFTYLFIDTQSKGRIYGPATVRLPNIDLEICGEDADGHP